MMEPRKSDVSDDQLDRAADEAEARVQLQKGAAERSDQVRLNSAKAKVERESPKGEASERARAAPQREFASPPPPAAAAPVPAIPPVSVEAQAQAQAASQKSSEKKAKKKTERAAASESSPQDLAEDSAAASAPDPALARASRAESLMTAGRWAQAVSILRDLLRRYPSHPAVPRWRAMLDAAQAGLNASAPPVASPPPPR